MTNADNIDERLADQMPKLPIAAAIVALIGVADASYLTVHHYTQVPVPCSIVAGCETVLTSQWAEMGGVPLAAFGAAAYFVAFSLALLAAFGNRLMWTLFGVQVILMAAFTAWLVYLQGFVIGAFCQFCLISAATTFLLLILYLASRFTGRAVSV
ncbi:MAG TPA: vitamin K epoxide reductase family protein [Pyrinomonadaceae bacterium]|jgi:uncharacterized membrane protein|nr:vitamin K epoxide reductase family protein [Pyrinomonadaceae bacterium]